MISHKIINFYFANCGKAKETHPKIFHEINSLVSCSARESSSRAYKCLSVFSALIPVMVCAICVRVFCQDSIQRVN